MDIGTRIKTARIAKGYTQEELGNLLGVQKSAVAKWENGRVVNIKRSTLAKISNILEIAPVELISGVEEKPVETANMLADIFMDAELMKMIEEYSTLTEPKKVQVRDFVHFLSGKN